MKKCVRLETGQRVYEVLIYKVRPAVVTGVRSLRKTSGPCGGTTVYEIRCDDGSLSPRYYGSDVGVALFTDPEEARKKCEENIRFRSEIGSRGSYGRSDPEEALEKRIESVRPRSVTGQRGAYSIPDPELRALANLGYLARREGRPRRRKYGCRPASRPDSRTGSRPDSREHFAAVAAVTCGGGEDTDEV